MTLCDRIPASFLALSLLGACQTVSAPESLVPVSPQQAESFADLETEYADFSTLALTQAYLTRKVQTWVNTNKDDALLREIDFARTKHPNLLLTLLAAEPALCQSVLAKSSVQAFRAQSPDFDAYVQSFACGVPGPSPTPTSTPTPTPTPTVPALGEFQVDFNTEGTAEDYPAIALDDTGRFVVTWTSDGGVGQKAIKSRIFDVNGQPLTDEIQVDGDASITKDTSATAITPTGFVVTWCQLDNTPGYGNSANVYAQRFNWTGVKLGEAILVNPSPTSTALQPDIAVNSSGEFVVTWRGGAGDDVYLRRYDPDGTPLSSEVRVNTYTDSTQANPRIAMNAAGQFALVWRSAGQDGDSNGVFGQRYTAEGNPAGAEFRVNTRTTGSQSDPDIAMGADGNFIVTWTNQNMDGNGNEIRAQRYLNNLNEGLPLGDEFQVNAGTEDHKSSRVVMDNQGRFAVTWAVLGRDGSAYGVYAKLYQSNTGILKTDFLVNTSTSGDQDNPSIALNNTGLIMMAWRDGRNGGEIYSQRYDSQGNPL